MQTNPDRSVNRVSARYLTHVERLVRSATRYTEVYFDSLPRQRGKATTALAKQPRALPC